MEKCGMGGWIGNIEEILRRAKQTTSHLRIMTTSTIFHILAAAQQLGENLGSGNTNTFSLPHNTILPTMLIL